MSQLHTCSYYCDRPECIRAQRDELRDKVEALRNDAERLKHLHDDPKRAQAYFWNYQGRKQRTEAIDAAMKEGK